MLFHHRERLIALLHPVLERMLLQLASALDQGEPEPGLAEIGLERMLLEEHPLQCLGAVDAVLRRERGAAGDVPEDRVGFRQISPRCDFQQRHAAAGILRQKIRRPGLALEDIELDQAVRYVEL